MYSNFWLDWKKWKKGD